MSVLAPTVPLVIHPWRRLRDLAEWTLHWHHPADDARMGVTRFSERSISLRNDLDWAERRCTVMHEVLHAERGPVLDTWSDQEEIRVRKQTARLLIPDVRVIGEALAWALSPEEAADELHVDVGVLRDRLRWLHPSERGYLTRRLEEVD